MAVNIWVVLEEPAARRGLVVSLRILFKFGRHGRRSKGGGSPGRRRWHCSVTSASRSALPSLAPDRVPNLSIFLAYDPHELLSWRRIQHTSPALRIRSRTSLGLLPVPPAQSGAPVQRSVPGSLREAKRRPPRSFPHASTTIVGRWIVRVASPSTPRALSN